MNIGCFKSILREELNHLLKERVSSKTLSPEKLDKRLKSYLSKKYKMDTDEKLIEKGPHRSEWNQSQYLTVSIPSEVESKENWNKFFTSYGYYVADKMNDAWSDYHHLKLYKYETQEVDPPKYVYHLTPVNKLLKIKRKGLVPKKSSKIYDVDESRVYFVTDWDAVLQIDSRLANETEVRPPFGNELAALKINTDKVDGKFYRDFEVSSNWSIFTRSNVPPEAIINWDDFDEELEVLKNRKINESIFLENDSGSLRDILQKASGKFQYTAPNNAYVKGKFGSEKDYGKVVSLTQMQADKTSMLKGQGEGRGTRILAEVLREAVRRGIRYYTFNVPSDAAQALHKRFERFGILEPFMTYRDKGGVTDDTAVYKIVSDTPVEDMESKFDLPKL